jgi:hypothetical protein
MRWDQISLDMRLAMIDAYKYGAVKDVSKWAEQYDIYPSTLQRRIQEAIKEGNQKSYLKAVKAKENSKVNSFPDKKKGGVSFRSVLDQILSVQKYKQDKSNSQDEGTWKVNPEYSELPIAITWMCDIHFGSLGTDYEIFQQDLNTIINTPNMYLMTGGDEIDNFNVSKHPAGIWDDGVSPEDQIIAWCDILDELNDKEKIVAVVWGNHTEFSQDAGINPFNLFAEHLSCPIFMDGGGVLNVIIGQQVYRLGLRQ